MILHITRTKPRRVPTFEFIKKFSWIFTQKVHQNINSSAVRHPDHCLDDPGRARAMNEFRKAGYKRLTAFKPKPFGSRIFGAKVFLKTLGGDQSIKNSSLNAIAERRLGPCALHSLLNPHLFSLVRDVHVLCTD